MILIANQIDESFYRVHVIRGGGHVKTSILSVPLARRILPKLLDNWSVTEDDRHGVFDGVPIQSPTAQLRWGAMVITDQYGKVQVDSDVWYSFGDGARIAAYPTIGPPPAPLLMSRCVTSEVDGGL